MPAEFETGFSVREPMWHGLGTVLDDYPGSWAEARRLAGLEWEPVEELAYDVVELYADGTAKVAPIEGFKQIKRSDNRKRLTIAQDSYHLISHDVMGEIFEAVLDRSDGEVRYETAGSLQEGKKVWALARLGGELHLPGDPSPIQPYFALLNSHDGNTSLRAIKTSVRIVCMNTWHAADLQAAKRGTSYSFRHTSGWKDRVEEAKLALATSRAQVEQTIEQAKAMLRVQVKAAQTKTFIEEFAIYRVISNTVGRRAFSKTELAERMSKPRVQRALTTTRDQLTAILESVTCDGIKDSMWGWVQAGGEFMDHIREAESNETRFSRSMLVDREPGKVDVVKLAEQVLATT